jgi:hypothetical protein
MTVKSFIGLALGHSLLCYLSPIEALNKLTPEQLNEICGLVSGFFCQSVNAS